MEQHKCNTSSPAALLANCFELSRKHHLTMRGEICVNQKSITLVTTRLTTGVEIQIHLAGAFTSKPQKIHDEWTLAPFRRTFHHTYAGGMIDSSGTCIAIYLSYTNTRGKPRFDTSTADNTHACIFSGTRALNFHQMRVLSLCNDPGQPLSHIYVMWL